MNVLSPRAKAAKIGCGIMVVLLGVLIVKHMRKQRKAHIVRPPNQATMGSEEVRQQQTLSIANSWLAMWFVAFSASAFMIMLITKAGDEMYNPEQPDSAGIYAVLMGILFPCSWFQVKLSGMLIKRFIHSDLGPDGGGWAVYQGYLSGLLASGLLLHAYGLATAFFVLVAIMWPYFWRKPKQN